MLCKNAGASPLPGKHLISSPEDLFITRSDDGVGPWCSVETEIGSPADGSSEAAGDTAVISGRGLINEITAASQHCVLRVENVPGSWTATLLFNNLKFYCGDSLCETLLYNEYDQRFFKQGLVEVDNQYTSRTLLELSQVEINGGHLAFFQSAIRSIATVRDNYDHRKFTSCLGPADVPGLWADPSQDELSPLFTPLAADGYTPVTPAEPTYHFMEAKAICQDEHTGFSLGTDPQPVPKSSTESTALNAPGEPFSNGTLSRAVALSNLKIADGGTYLHLLAAKHGSVQRVDVCLNRCRAYILFETNEDAVNAAKALNGATIGKSLCKAEIV